MGHVAVLEAANHMDDGVGGADVGQELVAQTFTLGGALHKTGDVHKLDDGGGHLLGLVQLGKPGQPLIGHGHHAHVGVDGAEGIVVRRYARIGNGVKQSGLAHIRQSHDT